MIKSWTYYLDNFDGTYEPNTRLITTLPDGSEFDSLHDELLVKNHIRRYGGWDRDEVYYYGFSKDFPKSIVTYIDVVGEPPNGKFRPWQETLF